MRNFILAVGGIYLAIIVLTFGFGAITNRGEGSIGASSGMLIDETESAEVNQSVSLPVVANETEMEAEGVYSDNASDASVSAESASASEEIAAEKGTDDAPSSDNLQEAPEIPEVYREFVSEEMITLSRFRELLIDPAALARDSNRLAVFFAQYSSSRSYLVDLHNDLDPALQPFNLALIETYASAQDITGFMMSAELEEYSNRSVSRLEQSVDRFSADYALMIDELRKTEIIQ